MRDVHGIGAGKSFSSMGWTAFAASCFVVMSSAVRLFKNEECDDVDSGDANDEFCDRTKLAVSLGAICGVVGVVWVGLGACFPAIVDAILGMAMLAAWCFGVGYITFGGLKAPAQDLGNLYFATWASFILAVKLTGDGAGKVFGMFTRTEEEPAAEEPTDEHQEVAPKEHDGDEKEGGDAEAGGDGDSA